jgi:5'-nucleotidase
MAEEKLWLRIIQINDVYELGNLPHFKSLVDDKKGVADETIVILAGDFLGPSLLSSLDKGRGMIDTLNNCGITHVCFGNHETDVPMDQLANRIMESKFKWVNTNMRELDEKLDIETSPHDVIELSHGAHSKKIGLIGLLTDDKSVYRPGSFGGAEIEPVIDCTEKYLKDVLEPMNLDMIIPLTHQRMHFDRIYCEKFKGSTFPIIIGGHDHEPFSEKHEGSLILKAGMDGENTAVIDITWKIEGDTMASEPQIEVDMMPTNSFSPDPEIRKMVKFHERIIQELQTAKIFRLDDWRPEGSDEPFSTATNRLGPTTGSTILASLIRMGMRTQCCIMNAGNIRGSKVYPKDQEWFTWKDLKAEIAFPTEMCALDIPGKVIEDTIYYSRRLVRQDPPMATGGYLHHCDKIKMDEKFEKILEIQGEPFDPEKMYFTCLPGKFFSGIDNHVPLLEWASQNNIEVDEENGKPAKLVVVEAFAALLWLEMGSFETIDTDGDGVLSRDEVRAQAVKVFGEDVADMVVDSVFGVADLNHTGVITPVDMMVVQFVATDMLDHVATNEELAIMQKVASEVLGKRPSHMNVKKMMKDLKDVLDVDKSGHIDREEAINVIGEVKRRSLLY